jgi:hypothetical protein
MMAYSYGALEGQELLMPSVQSVLCIYSLLYLTFIITYEYKYLCRLAVRIGGRHGDRGNLSLLSPCLPHILFYPTGNRTILDKEISPLAFLEFAPATFHRFSSHIHFAHLHRTFLTRQRQIRDGSLSLCM